MNVPNDRLTLRQAATIAAMAPATLAAEIEAGHVPNCYKLGRRYKIYRYDILRYIGEPVPANSFIRHVEFGSADRRAS